MSVQSDVTIRPMRAKDLPAVETLWQAAGLSVRPTGRDARDALQSQMEHDTAIYLVAELGGRIAGAVLGTHDRRKGWINRLAVHPDFRRRGIGIRLILACEQALRDEGLAIVAALIEHGNSGSVRAFERAGYVADVPVHYYRKRDRPDI